MILKGNKGETRVSALFVAFYFSFHQLTFLMLMMKKLTPCAQLSDERWLNFLLVFTVVNKRMNSMKLVLMKHSSIIPNRRKQIRSLVH